MTTHRKPTTEELKNIILQIVRDRQNRTKSLFLSDKLRATSLSVVLKEQLAETGRDSPTWEDVCRAVEDLCTANKIRTLQSEHASNDPPTLHPVP